jgi:hypothetical protein
MVLRLKIGWDDFHYMMHQGLASRSLLCGSFGWGCLFEMHPKEVKI